MSATGALVAPSCMIKRWRRQGITYPVENHEEENQAIVAQPPLGHAASCCEGLTRCWLISAIQAALRGSISHIPRLAYVGRASPEIHQALHPLTTTSGIRFPHSLTHSNFDVIPTASNHPVPSLSCGRCRRSSIPSSCQPGISAQSRQRFLQHHRTTDSGGGRSQDPQ
ncbi:hypothetical protein HMN09_00997000 [Mycena chlorophos]|uniref:Uncharacterized protein n=1 Tax=Mycena chlorophos TaxID=658473 RepID=A0A8H6VZG5_MYCCL|nr:hypothetical protein HMN09_00997000 [Mycena chlorophos]